MSVFLETISLIFFRIVNELNKIEGAEVQQKKAELEYKIALVKETL